MFSHRIESSARESEYPEVYNAGRIPGSSPGWGNSWAFFVSIREGNNIGVIPAKAGIHEVLQKLQNAGFPLSRE
jgi:hypothetical protein